MPARTNTPMTAKEKRDAGIGCGCLVLICLVIWGIVSACNAAFGGDEPEPVRTLIPAATTAPRPTTPLWTLPPTTTRPAPTTTTRATTPPPTTSSDAYFDGSEDDDDRNRRAPAPATTRAPKPAPKDDSGGSVYYKNCAAVRAAGKAPIRRGDPGYSRDLDRDGDGEGCGGD